MVVLFAALMAPRFGTDRYYNRTAMARAQIHNFEIALGAYHTPATMVTSRTSFPTAPTAKPEAKG